MKVKSRMVAVALATLALGATATSASAQSLPTVPLPSVPSNPVIGTGSSQCATGLVVVSIGSSTVCAVPGAPQVGSSPTCPDGSIAATVSSQALVCVLPGGGQAACPSSTVSVQSPTGGSVVCVLPTEIQVPGASGCTDGLIPVQILGASLGCVSGAVLGSPGANGTGGANGQNGAPGATPAPTPAPAPNATTTTSTQAGASKSNRRILKPTLKLSSRLRGSAKGLIRSSTKKVVVTTIGRRHGRVVRFTKQFSLKQSGPATAARPYAARVKVTFKTTGRVSIRVTSRGGGSIKTATFKRTVRPR